MTLQQQYHQELKHKIGETLKLTNPMAIPRLTKIVVNVGLGEALADHKVIDKVSEQLSLITGQRPAPMRARVSIATFKLRAGEVVGLKVTLRSKRMYDFMEKLVRVVLPRMRDFQGIPAKSFDGQGNYHLGLSEQTLFPEIDYSKVDKIRGLEISFVTSTKSDAEARELLKVLGMPFEKEKK